MKRVLIMEDNLALAAEWREAFQLNEIEAVITPNAEEAIKHLAAGSFDLVVTDLFVKKGQGGLHVLGQLRKMRQDAPPAITVTGFIHPSPENSDENHYLRQAEKLGSTATIQKPFQPIELVMLAREVWASI